MTFSDKRIPTFFKTIILISLFLSLSFSSIAQISLSGEVKDNADSSLPYVDLLLQDAGTNDTITSGYTDNEGRFDLKVKQKSDYLLIVSYLGYETEYIPVALKENEEISVNLKENNQYLEEVLIKSTKPNIRQKVDRLVFNISQTISGSIGTANDALKSTPGVKVKEDAIEIIGKGEVRVLIDDKMVRLSGEDLHGYLNSIPAENIESIEVITNPPSRYEAEGNSGLINIVLKKAKKDSWSNSIRTNYKQRTYPSFGIGNTFLFNKDKVEISASVDITKGYMQRINELKLYYEEGMWEEPIYMKDKLDNLSGNLNVDYQLTEKANVGVTYNTGFRENDVSDYVHTRIFNQEEQELGSISSSGINDNPIKSHTIGVYYDQKLDSLGRKLSLNLDYFGYENKQERNSETVSDYAEEQNVIMRNFNDQNIDNFGLNVDMEHPFDKTKFSYGGKLLFTKNRNRLSEEIYQAENENIQNDHFKYQENLQALYADVLRNFGEKWTVKAGLRAENTQTKGISEKEEDFKRSYVKWFPTVYLNYESNENNTYNLSYNRRINRPGFWALNPSKWYINSTSYTQGNPFLQPAFTDNIELKHSYKNQLFSSVFITKEKEGYTQIPTVNSETKEQIYYFDNLYKSTVFGINEIFEFSPMNWWKSRFQASLGYTNGKYNQELDGLGEFNNGWNFDFYTNHNFFLNTDKTLQLETSFTYSSPQKAMMYDIQEMTSFNLGFRALFLHEKLQVNLLVNDVFKGMESKITTYTNNVKQEYKNYYDSRNFRISLAYKFGDENLKSMRREAKNKEIQNRTQ